MATIWCSYKGYVFLRDIMAVECTSLNVMTDLSCGSINLSVDILCYRLAPHLLLVCLKLDSPCLPL